MIVLPWFSDVLPASGGWSKTTMEEQLVQGDDENGVPRIRYPLATER